ncbi:hypothetical protein [Halalkalibacter oceani]|uniref:hypothetical protein n=1 Tax=Halalkalibacter oceani TaxID=1653776 RepID=UPI0033982F7D
MKIIVLTHKNSGATATIIFEGGKINDISIQGNDEFNRLVICHGAILRIVKLNGRTYDKAKIYAIYSAAEGYNKDIQAEITKDDIFVTDDFLKFFDIKVGH